MLAELKGEFLGGLIYSKSLSIPQKLAANLISLSGSVGGLEDII